MSNNECFVIAEAGSNWKCGSYDDDLKQAEKLIKTAANSGANAVKIQSYEADTITLKSKNKNFLINDKSIWKNQNF